MLLAFEEIKKSDVMLVEISEKGVGLGIEIGYAFAVDVPIILMARLGSDISNTVRGICKEVFFYKDTEDIPNLIKDMFEGIQSFKKPE
jgi:hypothetical protein